MPCFLRSSLQHGRLMLARQDEKLLFVPNFRRALQRGAGNYLTAGPVLTWSLSPCWSKVIKPLLGIHGFEEMQKDSLVIYADTTS